MVKLTLLSSVVGIFFLFMCTQLAWSDDSSLPTKNQDTKISAERLYTGTYVRNFNSGAKMHEATFKNGKLDGIVRYWFENEQLQCEESWKDGVIDGQVSCVYPDGKKQVEYTMKHGVLNGSLTKWDSKGNIVSELTYENGRIVNWWACIFSNCKKYL